MSDIVFSAPWKGIADQVCDELSGPPGGTPELLPWEHGEPEYFYKVGHRTGRGWCVVRYVQGEVDEKAPF